MTKLPEFSKTLGIPGIVWRFGDVWSGISGTFGRWDFFGAFLSVSNPSFKAMTSQPQPMLFVLLECFWALELFGLLRIPIIQRC